MRYIVITTLLAGSLVASFPIKGHAEVGFDGPFQLGSHGDLYVQSSTTECSEFTVLQLRANDPAAMKDRVSAVGQLLDEIYVDQLCPQSKYLSLVLADSAGTVIDTFQLDRHDGFNVVSEVAAPALAPAPSPAVEPDDVAVAPAAPVEAPRAEAVRVVAEDAVAPDPAPEEAEVASPAPAAAPSPAVEPDDVAAAPAAPAAPPAPVETQHVVAPADFLAPTMLDWLSSIFSDAEVLETVAANPKGINAGIINAAITTLKDRLNDRDDALFDTWKKSLADSGMLRNYVGQYPVKKQSAALLAFLAHWRNWPDPYLPFQRKLMPALIDLQNSTLMPACARQVSQLHELDAKELSTPMIWSGAYFEFGQFICFLALDHTISGIERPGWFSSKPYAVSLQKFGRNVERLRLEPVEDADIHVVRSLMLDNRILQSIKTRFPKPDKPE